MHHEPTIIFEDNDIIVLDKPSGITVNNADTTKGERTIQDFVEGKFQISNFKFQVSGNSQSDDNKYDINQEFLSRGGIVHRLDKETSGILLVAKNPRSFGNLKEQFMSRSVKKTYTALSHGKIIPKNGQINAPVGRLPFNRTHFGVIAGGREALTLYNVVNYYLFSKSKKNKETLSLVELFPQTGRTHQIRVHLKYINHPIFSDMLYAGRKVSRDDRKYLPRLFLHASRIRLFHPDTNKQLEFASNLPIELQSFLSNLTPISNF